MGGKFSVLNLGSKGQRSNALDIELEIQFPGCIMLTFPPRITILRFWTKTWEEDVP
jgi:hypothetical protein